MIPMIIAAMVPIAVHTHPSSHQLVVDSISISSGKGLIFLFLFLDSHKNINKSLKKKLSFNYDKKIIEIIFKSKVHLGYIILYK